MSNLKKTREMHLVCSSGGTKALLLACGTIYGLCKIGRTNWRSIGGISGGSIPAAFYAAGFNMQEVLKLSIRTDFNALLQKQRGLIRTVRRYMQQTQRLPRKALMTSEPLGEFIDSLIPSWPEKFWTMASCDLPNGERCQVLFTDHGVFLYNSENKCTKLSDKPAPLGLAIRASCAVPGVIGPVEYKGLYLFDGIMTWDGRCPVGVPKRHFKANLKDCVAINCGDGKRRFAFLEETYMDYWSKHVPQRSIEAWERAGVTVLNPVLESFGSLKLKLTNKDKWAAIRAGRDTALRAYELMGTLVA